MDRPVAATPAAVRQWNACECHQRLYLFVDKDARRAAVADEAAAEMREIDRVVKLWEPRKLALCTAFLI